MALIGGRNCRTCEHVHKMGAQFFCVRFPPQVFAVSGPQGAIINATYPLVNPEIPCGEYHRDEGKVAVDLAGERVGAVQ